MTTGKNALRPIYNCNPAMLPEPHISKVHPMQNLNLALNQKRSFSLLPKLPPKCRFTSKSIKVTKNTPVC